MLKLKISTNNKAFKGDKRVEVIKILRDAIKYISYSCKTKELYDTNGNKVGEYSLTNR